MKFLRLKNKISKIKNSLDGLNSWMEETEERVNELEAKSVKSIQSEKQEKTLKIIKRFRDLWNNIGSKIQVIGFTEERRDTVAEKYICMKGINLQIQEAQQISNRLNSKKTT